MDGNRSRPIDLTLKLGPSSPEEQDNQDRGDNNEQQRPPRIGVENAELNNPLPQDGENEDVALATPNFYMFYPPYPPQDPGSPSRRVCRRCGSLVTPLWRKGPDGRQTLCNACGLKHIRALKRGAE